MNNSDRTGDSLKKNFFEELVLAVEGRADRQISMYTLGEALGLDKAHCQTVAQDLMADGLAEVRTLAGAIGLTAEGVTEAGDVAGGIEESLQKEACVLDLKTGPDGLLDADGCQALIAFQKRLAQAMREHEFADNDWQAAVTYFKAVDLCLTAPRPAWAVIREGYRAMHGAASNEHSSSTRLTELLASALKGN